MNQKKVLFIFILTITLIGMGLLSFQSNYLAKVIHSSNSYITIEDYPKQDSLGKLNKVERQRYLLLYDEKDDVSIQIKDNLSKILTYIKKDFKTINIEEFTGLSEGTAGVIICFEDLDQNPKIEEVFSFVKQGGSLLMAMRPMPGKYFHTYEQAMGIEEYTGVVNKHGMRLLSNVLIQGKGYSTDEEFMENSCLEVDLMHTATVHVTTTDGLPLLWENPYGMGNIVMNNTAMFTGTKSRGYILGTIALMEDDFIYPIINAKVNFLDDFPSPVPGGSMANHYSGLNISVEQFYRNIWWPSMLKVAKDYNLIYSGMIIESYGNNVQGPFLNDNTTASDSLFYFGQELLQNGGEMGFHGYNHQSLTYDAEHVKDEDYNEWQSEEDIEASLKELNDFSSSVFKNYEFRSYVPPSNILSLEVRKKLPQFLPNIKVICSLYGKNEGAGTYSQEYEVAEDGIVEFPRISSGYMEEADSKWDVLNGISLHGVVAHFIHPDDILNDCRNAGMQWEDLIMTYSSVFEEIHNKFSWLRPLKVSDASEELKKFLDCEVSFVQDKTNIYGYCNNFRKDMYFILRTDKKIAETKNCNTKKIDENVYWVYTQKPEFSITFEEVR